jgi:hypothetical protein
MLLPTDLIFDMDPLWRSLAPEGYTVPGNHNLSDQVLQVFPWRAFTERALREGYLPLWNPYSSGGMPFVGNAQSAVFGPFNLIGYLFPLESSYLFTAILRLMVAGLFTFLFAREIGMGKPGALLAMIAFTYSGPLIVWLGHPPTHVIIWLPAMLWATDRALTTKGMRYIIISSLTIAAQFLGGHPETSFHVMITWATYSLYRALRLDGRLRSHLISQLARIGGAALLGTLLAGAQLLPLAEALVHSSTVAERVDQADIRTTSPLQHTLWEWHAWPTLVTAVLPQYFGTPVDKSYFYPHSNYIEQDMYLGILPLALAATAVLRSIKARPDPRQSHIVFFALLSAVCLGVAVRLPVISLVNELPLFSVTSQARLRLIYAFTASILAGYGMDGLVQGLKNYRKVTLVSLIVLASVSLTLVLAGHIGFVVFKEEIVRSGRDFIEQRWGTLYYSRPIEDYYALVDAKVHKKLAQASPANVITYLPLIVAMVWLALSRWVTVRHATVWTYAALGLTMLDVFLVGMPFHPTTDPEHIFPKPAAIQFLERDDGVFRVSGLGAILYPNTGIVFDLADVRGYDSVIPRRYVDLFDRVQGSVRYRFHLLLTDANSPLLDLMNVKYVLTTRELEGRWELVYSDPDEIRVYRNRDVLPRAFIVHSIDIAEDAEQSLARITDSGFDYRKRVVLEEEPTGWTEPRQAPPVASVSITRYGPDRIGLTVDTKAKGVLVLTDTYAPGWKASIDGQPARVYIADHAFRAVTVPAGRHRVEFVYEPLSFRIGAVLSLLTLAALTLISLVLGLKRITGSGN